MLEVKIKKILKLLTINNGYQYGRRRRINAFQKNILLNIKRPHSKEIKEI
jgi:hypothetical protein